MEHRSPDRRLLFARVRRAGCCAPGAECLDRLVSSYALVVGTLFYYADCGTEGSPTTVFDRFIDLLVDFRPYTITGW